MTKKILINIFCICIIFILFDFILYNYLSYKLFNDKFRFDIPRYMESLKIINFDDEYKKLINENYFRNAINTDKTIQKKPILIFGCSFGYGWLLEENQAFAYKLHEYTGRNIYNQSISSLGLQYFPYIMGNFKIENHVNIPSLPEYIIFIFIDNHVYRLYRYFYEDIDPKKDIRYKLKNNKLTQISDRNYFFQKFVTFRQISNFWAKTKYYKTNFNDNFDFMKAHFLYAKELAKKKFPNAKLVILKYEEDPNSELFYSDRWSELEKEGFIILDTYKLTGKHLYRQEYRIINDVHPNEYAWDILTPKIVETLKL